MSSFKYFYLTMLTFHEYRLALSFMSSSPPSEMFMMLIILTAHKVAVLLRNLKRRWERPREVTNIAEVLLVRELQTVTSQEHESKQLEPMSEKYGFWEMLLSISFCIFRGKARTTTMCG